MSVTVTINAADVSELQRMCAELAHSGAPAPIVEAATTVADPMAKARAAKAVKNSSKVTAEAVTQPVEEMTQTAVSPPAAEASTGASSSPSLDDMTAKLRTLSSTADHGMPAVSAILKEFKAFKDGKYTDKKVERIKELNPEDYAAVIAKVDAALSQS